MTAERIAEALHGRRSGRGWMARCPAHEDRSPSLSLRDADGRVLVHCHTGCSQANVIAALQARGLWPQSERLERTPEERQQWAEQRRDIERDLPAARLWRRMAVAMSESLLNSLKGALVAPDLPAPDVGELSRVTALLARLKSMGDAALVSEYREWQRNYPDITRAMLQAARDREQMERRALLAYLRRPA